MTIIDFTAQMALAGTAVVALLVVTGAAIGCSIDDVERERLRDSARRVGAWWLGRGATCPVGSR